MLMKVVAPFSDLGAEPSRSTKGADDKDLGFLRDQDLLIGVCLFDGPDTVSTGLRVVTGDIRKAISVTKQTIIAKSKPLAMAAAA